MENMVSITVLDILENVLIGFMILISGAIILSILNFYIQKKRTTNYCKQGYISCIDRGFHIKKDKNGKFKITS